MSKKYDSVRVEMVDTLNRLTMNELNDLYVWFKENIQSQGVYAKAQVNIIIPSTMRLAKIDAPPQISSYLDNDTELEVTHFNCLHCKEIWATYEADKIIPHILDVLKLWK